MPRATGNALTLELLTMFAFAKTAGEALVVSGWHRVTWGLATRTR